MLAKAEDKSEGEEFCALRRKARAVNGCEQRQEHPKFFCRSCHACQNTEITVIDGLPELTKTWC